MKGASPLDFRMWGVWFPEEVRVMDTIPNKNLVKGRFWRKQKLQRDIEISRASIVYSNERIYDSLVCNSPRRAEDRFEVVQMVIEDSAVDDAIRGMELSESLDKPDMQVRIRELFWQRRSILEEL